MRSLQQAGDTIVEVLVAISIVSLVLTSAYLVTNRNYASMQDALERTQAHKLLERQIESIKAYAFINRLDPLKDITKNPPAENFCIDLNTGDGSLLIKKVSANECNYLASGDRTNSGGLLFAISITREATPPTGPSGQLFKATAKWDNISGQGQDSTQLQYGVYSE